MSSLEVLVLGLIYPYYTWRIDLGWAMDSGSELRTVLGPKHHHCGALDIIKIIGSQEKNRHLGETHPLVDLKVLSV